MNYGNKNCIFLLFMIKFEKKENKKLNYYNVYVVLDFFLF